MKTLKRILTILVITLFAVGTALAEQVNVTITPKRTVLPPQVLLYITNPGLYFNISVNNPESEAQSIFFGAEIHQLMPSNGMDIIVPAKTYPIQGITIPANQSRMLDALEMRNMFNHVQQNDLQIPQSLFDNALSGSFGLLDEGTYELVLNAYKWDPRLSSPVLLSNPVLSSCTFNVCYQATAPKWIAPMSMNDYEDRNVATLSKQAPMLQWSTPAVSCNTTPIQYTYDLKIVQTLPFQYPDEAIERNAVVYQKTGLTMSQCLIPANIITNFAPTETYVAQVTARSNNTQEGSLDYILLQNGGKSDLLQFRVKDYSVVPETPKVETPEPEDTTTVDIFGLGGKNSLTDSLYFFRNPEITTPSFTISGGARKLFTGHDITVEWRKGEYLGGQGNRPDSLNFAYAVQLFASEEYLKRDEMLEREPIYTSKSLSQEFDTIYWDDIEDKVNKGDYMLIRVVPAVLNENSVAFTGDSLNIVDFALIDRFTPSYFQCSNGLEVTNTKPTKRTAKDFEDMSVKVGEYELVLDGAKFEAIDKKPGHFSGTGHVIWTPFNNCTWKLAVKFDDIAINTDDEVYEGMVETFEGDNMDPLDGSAVVDKLFSDWGIDNLIADTGIPYADKLQGFVDGKVASLADELGDKISSYYNEIKSGKNKIVGLLNGSFENVCFPLQIPDEINPTPVDLQISKMKFTPTYASMDFFGTFAVPETEVTNNEILVFGAPRICISPKSLIPEGTTIALIKDFTIKDPDTDYDCTFKAPQDVISPMDGCYVSWSGSEFEAFRIDLDMTMPNLKKVKNGKVTDEKPKLHIIADVKAPITKKGQKLAGWDWYGIASLDDFEHEDLPGYTFSVGKNVYVDHSSRENAKGMPKFPKDYDLAKAQLQGKAETEWMGVYIEELSMAFPEDIKVGEGEERMKVGLYNMFIDKSGMTVEAGIVNSINYKAGESATIGGFAFSMDTISVNFIQNQHKDFKFSGKMEVPLFDGQIHYACNVYNQKFSQRGTKEGYAYVFKTWQLENINFDFVLADLSLNKKLTYFLVEALPDKEGKLHTNCELMLGGEIELACAEKVNSKLADLPMDLTLPGIKFCNMRLANNEGFESTYEPEMQTTAQDVLKQWTVDGNDDEGNKITWWNKAKNISLCGGELFLNLGQWGYSSPQKKIGPFNFALRKYDVDLKGEDLSFTLGGDVTLCNELKITAGTEISFHATVKNLSLNKIADLSLEYNETKFDKLYLDVEVTGFKLDGSLTAVKTETDKGYKGKLDIEIAENLFKLEAVGGYYDHTDGDDRWSYGFFKAEGSSEMGVPMGPIALKGLEGGVYFNCAFNASDEENPTPKKGAIGVIFGVELGTLGTNTFTGDFDFAFCVLKNEDDDKDDKYYLSTFKFDGEMECLDGTINSTVSLVYENNTNDEYFQLNATVDAKADGMAKKYAQKIEEAKSALEELTGKAQATIDEAKGELESMFGDKSKKKSDIADAKKAYEDKTKDDKEGSGKVKATAGATATLDIRIQSRKDGKDLENVLWHVYIGEPDDKMIEEDEESKRCVFTLVNFKSEFVNVNVGASAYLCIGSELPNDGQLPPLPAKVEKFLNGSSDTGVQSDSKSTATSAQQKTLDEVKANAKLDGGVMIGAQVWGYIDVNLGLFYGDMGATAGFDLAITHYSNSAKCVNLGSAPGINGWYGSGQLYAYLYAKFGFNIDLGFFHKKLDLVDAGIGGVLQARLPNPNYFTGRARCKLHLLNGLVKINRTFQFECGEGCDMFVGNALDKYQLFETCNLGSEKIDDIEKNKISWKLDAKPTISTQAEIGTSVRVLDPTQEEKLKNSAQSSEIADFSAWASRLFHFDIPADRNPKLYEYANLEDCKHNNNAKVTSLDYTINGESIVLSLTSLNANKYYKLAVTGIAEEFHAGSWHDPETWDEDKGKYIPTPWSQTKNYYFCTDDSRTSVNGIDDLNKVVAVAFPMAKESIENGKVILKSKEYVDAPICDIIRPMISLNEGCKDALLSGKEGGKLKWAIYPAGYQNYQADGVAVTNYPKDYFYAIYNKWIENDSVSILTPESDFAVSDKFTSGVIKLLYEWDEDVNDLGDWIPIGSFDVFARNQKSATEQANKIMATKFQDLRKINRQIKSSEFRVSVEREDNAIDDNANASKFTVKILQFKKNVKTVTYTKELYSIPVNALNFDSDKYFTSKNQYWSNYAATRLNSISIDDDLTSSETNTFGMNFPATSDIDLIGGSTKTAKYMSFSKFNEKYSYVTKDPAAYLSYLSNLFFITGYKLKSSDMGIDVVTSLGLSIKTPFKDSFEDIGKLRNKDYAYQVYNGYGSLVKTIFMNPAKYAGAQTPYPLCDYNDSRIGAVMALNGMQATIQGYLDQFANLYETCARLNELVSNQLTYSTWFTKSDWKEWLRIIKTGPEPYVEYGSESAGTKYTIKLSPYQIPLVAYAPIEQNFLNNTVKTVSNDTKKHWRINSSSGTAGDIMRSKMTYAAMFMDANGNVASDGYKNLLNDAVFGAECKILIKSIDYTRYRVNAWNFKNLRYTVYLGTETKTPTNYFCKHVTLNYPFYSSKTSSTSSNLIKSAVRPRTNTSTSSSSSTSSSRRLSL